MRERSSWVEFARRLYHEYEHDSVPDSAAALSFYFVFSLFPFLFFLVTLAAYIPGVQASTDALLERMHAFVPKQAMGLVESHLRALVGRPRPHLLTLGLAATVYSSSRGVDALRKALNRAYDVDETRPFWHTELLAFGMTIGGALLVLAGIAILVAGGDVGLWVAGHLDVADVYVRVLGWARWPITAVAILTSAALCYALLPNARRRFELLTPGTVLATIAWFVASWGFATYVTHFGKYNVTYGSIGGVIVLMTWFYISAFIILMGGEIDATREQLWGPRRPGRGAPRPAPPAVKDWTALPNR